MKPQKFLYRFWLNSIPSFWSIYTNKKLTGYWTQQSIKDNIQFFSTQNCWNINLGYFVNWEGITRRIFVVLNSPRRTKIISYCYTVLYQIGSIFFKEDNGWPVSFFLPMKETIPLNRLQISGFQTIQFRFSFLNRILVYWIISHCIVVIHFPFPFFGVIDITQLN